MKKEFLKLFVILLFTVFAGCSKEEDNSADENGITQEQEEESVRVLTAEEQQQDVWEICQIKLEVHPKSWTKNF
jgi:ABC-type metal ion transport system substrate-binding protein